ncbi:bifunctional DNA-formamidopyrimidine glycosylase/DNA-(apurinic or apyrimidinic site) lyase [Corynebacterium caspium]|uniref:bifunctional DNA-formamidopyrimidine glycosylase/DNA-(apurinic or apyrimidinic site) lyase n=1 Tax=Corynebacterium caspium TaxID=234828 RepID=UPI0003605A54|nr:bifunctional DNA-formamidopyrimidine glycosylase/DNA-(apurinic or apyrimidinic site) lyase [Corynebacterium caspium]WKD59045.1 Formamidopyrimidine-DNA glycosylase 1 [Corynebacterium caspium DSM 44850]
MPELPEVEVVRRGLEAHVLGKKFSRVEILHPRAVRHNPGGATEVITALTGREVSGIKRRGKFMWLEFDDATSLIVHLGMSGQMLIKAADTGNEDPNWKHLRARAELSSGSQLWFVDQRTFGYWRSCQGWQTQAGMLVPEPVKHIAPDVFDPGFNGPNLAQQFKQKKSELKRLLLDQSLISGVGNIYADEMLWLSQLHPQQIASRVALPKLESLFSSGAQVMEAALAQGGTSFDALYVNVNGQSGYFSRALHAYGREGKPCDRCQTELQKITVAGRSSHFCPSCQQRY